MRKLIKLKKDFNIVFDNSIVEFLNPDCVYLPIKYNYDVLVKCDENVLKGQIIMENNLNKELCPISGIVGQSSTYYCDGVKVNALLIQNDFKEKNKIYTRKKTTTLNKENIISKLYDFYFKYIANILETKTINNLVINGIEDEPYIENNPFVLKKYHKEILELADTFSSAFNIQNTIIAIKSSNTQIIETYLSKIGTYPNITIKLIDDKYLLGKSFFLMENLMLKDNDTLIIDARTFYYMYNALKYNKDTTETFITISGNAIKKSLVMKVKIGTLLKDIVDNFIKIINKDCIYVLNGLMGGYECNINNTIVSKNTLGLIICAKDDIQESECNLCGLCYKICPVKVNPKKVIDTKIMSENCIDCGLCSYICPCHINLRKYLRGEYE